MRTFCNSARGRAAAAVAVLAGLWAGPARADEPVIIVTLDKASVLKMPPGAETIVDGNPSIADVTTLKHGVVVVTGKGFGETNLVFLDGTGGAVEEVAVRVQASTSLLIVQRGDQRESYACQPRCQRTVALGDAKDAFKDAADQVTQRNQAAAPASH